MLKRALPVLIVLLLSAGASPAAQQPPLLVSVPIAPPVSAVQALDDLLFSYQTFDLPLGALSQQASQHGRLHLQVGGRALDLELSPNPLLAENYQAVLIGVDGKPVPIAAPEVATYAGRVIGEPRSVVRLTIQGDHFEGYVFVGEARLFIDPMAIYDRSAAPSEVVVYRQHDVRPLAAGTCGTEHLERSATRLLGTALTPELPRKAQTSISRIDLATDADGEFTQHWGTGPALSRIQSIINGVDGIYGSELGLDLRIVFQTLWASPSTDPYTSTNAQTRVAQFKNYWNSNFAWVYRNAAHLFSHADLSGSALGQAQEIGTICQNQSSSYAISSENNNGQTLSTSQMNTLVAHELGHNLGATHVNVKPCFDGHLCPTSSPRTGPVMCTPFQFNSNNEFTCCTREDLKNQQSCLDIDAMCF